jgi:hypothetical protein
MASALCNTCGSLVHWLHQPGKHQKRVCECGSADLTRVYSKMSADGTKWIFRDASGMVRAEREMGRKTNYSTQKIK